MQFLSNPQIEFIGKRYIGFALSGALMLLSIVVIFAKGIRYGIDFTGGTLIQIHAPVDISTLRSALSRAFPGETFEVQNFGGAQEFLVRTAQVITSESDFEQKLQEALGTTLRVDRVETVGPRVGKELRRQAVVAILLALVLMLAYIWFRFNLLFGVGAVLALFHDVLITLGIYTLLGREVSIPIIAAFLTIVGYSINDSIVVSDRVRENLRKLGRKEPSLEEFGQILNRSVNETLSRTILTSGTTLLVLLALLVLGGAVNFDFALALTIGVIVGTYSSIFVVVNLVYEWTRFRKGAPERS